MATGHLIQVLCVGGNSDGMIVSAPWAWVERGQFDWMIDPPIDLSIRPRSPVAREPLRVTRYQIHRYMKRGWVSFFATPWEILLPSPTRAVLAIVRRQLMQYSARSIYPDITKGTP